MGRECAPLVALAHLGGQSRRLPPWLSRPALGGTPPRGGGWPGSRTAIAQPPKGSELCAVPGIGMFSARGLFCGCASHSAVILLLLPADAIRIIPLARMCYYSSTFPTVRPWSVRTDLRRSQHATVQLYRTVPKYRSFATLCQLGRLQ